VQSGIHDYIVLYFQIIVNQVIIICCWLSQLILEHVFVGASQESEFVEREIPEHATLLGGAPREQVLDVAYHF